VVLNYPEVQGILLTAIVKSENHQQVENHQQAYSSPLTSHPHPAFSLSQTPPHTFAIPLRDNFTALNFLGRMLFY